MFFHTVRYFLGQTLARGMVYLYSIGLARFLSNEGFTNFTYFLIFSNIYSRLANYSLNMLIAKSRFDAGGDDDVQQNKQERLYRFATVFGFIVTSILIILNFVFNIFEFLGLSTALGNLILLSGYCQSVENNLIEYYQSKFQSQKYLIYMVSFTFFLTLLSGVGYWYNGFSFILTPIVTYTLSQFIVLILAGAFRFQFTFSVIDIKAYLISGTPICLYGLSSYAARYLEMLVLRNRLSVSELAAFTFIFRLVEALTLVMAAFAATTTPLIYASLKKGTFEVKEKSKIFNYYLFQIIFFTIYSFTAYPFVKFAFSEFQQSLTSVPLLFLIMSLTLFVSLGQSFVVYYNKLSEMLFCSLVGLSVGLVSSFFLVPRLGTQGALLSKITSLLITLAGYLWVVREEKLDPWKINLCKLAIVVVIMFGVIEGFYILYVS